MGLGLLLLKKEQPQLLKFEYPKIQNLPETKTLSENITNDKNFNNINKYGINEIIKNNKNYIKNKNSIQNKKYNKYSSNLETQDNNSLDELNNFYYEKKYLNKNKRNEKQNKKINEKVNEKVIIDDYSEFDNIKSLNSMDNTLSDLISVVEKN
jgi:hypothetical protein